MGASLLAVAKSIYLFIYLFIYKEPNYQFWTGVKLGGSNLRVLVSGRFWRELIVNLRNRTAEERRRQTLCAKRDNNSLWSNFSPNFPFF